MPAWWEEPKQWWESDEDYQNRTSPITPGQNWNNIGTPTPTPSPTPAPIIPDVKTVTGTEGDGSIDFGGWDWADYTGGALPSYNIPGAPRFTAPQFIAPTAESALNEPGYQFRSAEGIKALEQSAAGKGVLRTGGSLKELANWSQELAAQEYNNVYNRALQAFDRLYTGRKDEFAPLLAEWSVRAAAEQRAKDLAFQRAWDMYAFSHPNANAILGYEGG